MGAPDLPVPASIWRRLAAAGYDLLALAAIWMVAGAAWVALAGHAAPPQDPAFRAYLLAVTFAYYGWSWRHGRTLGMRPWRIAVRSHDGGPIGWPRLALRFAVALVGTALFGLGLAWALLDPRRRMWHDLAAGTEVVRTP